MGFWTLVKGAYKGSKYVMSGISEGLDVLNKELESFNTEQDLVRPLKDALHITKMNRLEIRSMEMAVPEQAKETRQLLVSVTNLLNWLETMFEYGIEDRNSCRNSCRNMIIEIAKEFKNNGYTHKNILDDFLEEYPLEILKFRGYKEPPEDFYTEDMVKIDRIKYAYRMDGSHIEVKAKDLHLEAEIISKKLNALSKKLNSVFKLSIPQVIL